MEFVFDNDRPIYIQLVEQLEKYIINGYFTPGAKIPSVRELASLTKVNPNTMQKALSELEIIGLIYTERTNGKFVTDDVKLISSRREKYAIDKAKKYLSDMEELGVSRADAITYLQKNGGKK